MSETENKNETENDNDNKNDAKNDESQKKMKEYKAHEINYAKRFLYDMKVY